jgi:hypothetical protein
MLSGSDPIPAPFLQRRAKRLINQHRSLMRTARPIGAQSNCSLLYLHSENHNRSCGSAATPVVSCPHYSCISTTVHDATRFVITF